jgi:hypothetical protein
VPIYSNGIEREMVTPTGAAIATTLATHFGAPPKMVLQQVGLGAGTQNLPLPNILRLWVGEAIEPGSSFVAEPVPRPSQREETQFTETIAVLETQIDDLTPQAIGYVLQSLLEAGALDVFTQAIGMKKSRPGVLLTVVCQPDRVATCETILFRETTTLGIRRSQQQRRVLPRQIQPVQTDYGTVRVKLAWAEGRDRPPTNVHPEYEDCARIAHELKIPWREVHRAALQHWYHQQT